MRPNTFPSSFPLSGMHPTGRFLLRFYLAVCRENVCACRIMYDRLWDIVFENFMHFNTSRCEAKNQQQHRHRSLPFCPFSSLVLLSFVLSGEKENCKRKICIQFFFTLTVNGNCVRGSVIKKIGDGFTAKQPLTRVAYWRFGSSVPERLHGEF